MVNEQLYTEERKSEKASLSLLLSGKWQKKIMFFFLLSRSDS